MIEALIAPITNLVSKFVPDKDQAAKLAHEIATMAQKHAHENAMAQIEVNKAEAASNSIFKGWWRPFIGCVCGIAFAYHFVLQPFLVFVLVTFNVTGLHPSDLQQFDMT